MQRVFVKSGYCLDCRQNVEHAHCFTLPAAQWLDRLTLQALPKLGIGSWHCRSCQRNSWSLHPRRRTAPDFVYESSPPEELVSSAGNFIRRDKSLALRADRNSRYSQKFRRSVVTRIISGQATLLSIRDELNVSEGDVISWIEEIITNQNEQIEHLTKMVDHLLDHIPDPPKITSKQEVHLD